MAFPTIPTVAAGRVLEAPQSDTSATRTFPDLSGLTKNSGDLLIAIIVCYQSSLGSNIFSSWGGGFTEFLDGGTANQHCIGAAYKISDGTETGTFSVTQGGTVTGHAAMFLLSIPGAHASTPPAAGTVVTSTTTTLPDPASLNPAAWDVEDTLWIYVRGDGCTSTSGTWSGIGGATPTDYTDAVTGTLPSKAVGAAQAGVAFRQLTAASEDPGTWGGDTSNTRHCAVLIAVRPAPVVATKTGAGITGSGSASGMAGGGVDAVIWAKAGAGALSAVGSGAREQQGQSFVKAGQGVMGLAQTAVTKTGTGAAGFSASGADAKTSAETGSGISAFVASGPDAATRAETGTGASSFVASGVDAKTSTETGVGILAAVGSGSSSKGSTFVKTGAGISAFDGSGSDATTRAETGSGISDRLASGSDATTRLESGTGILSAAGSGTSQRVGQNTYTKTGSGVSSLAASGADAVASAESGTAASARLVSGTDAKTSGETGAGILSASASGSKATQQGTTYVKSGASILVATASGAKALTFADSGTGASARVGSGRKAIVYGESGTGQVVLIGAGSRITEHHRSGAAILSLLSSGTKAGAFVYVAGFFDSPTPGIPLDGGSPGGSADGGSPAGAFFDQPTPEKVNA